MLVAVPVVDKEVNSRNGEVRNTLKKMKLGKAVGPDNKPGRMDVSRSLKGQQEVR